MPSIAIPQDQAVENLLARLQARTAEDPYFWDFSQLGKRQGNHALFQYPAMMVPELQGALLDDVVSATSSQPLVYDPFAGSGTVLVEARTRGLDFIGSDINPMALLLMAVKADPPSADDAKRAVEAVCGFKSGAGRLPLPAIPRLDKWFEPNVQDDLLHLKAAIRGVRSLQARRFLWVCLAETIRLTSNSRISTFKLHAYSDAEKRERVVDASRTFSLVAGRNVNAIRIEGERSNKGQIDGDRKKSSTVLLSGPAAAAWHDDLRADVLMTSPPYGDNKTTVPYGQHSYLPLAWIDGTDIPGGMDEAVLASASRIDSRSLGGSLVNADQAAGFVLDNAPSAALFAASLDQSSLRKKVLSFSRDYITTLSTAVSRLKPDAFCFLTLGERRVGGKAFPLVDATTEILARAGQDKLLVIERALPVRKRIGPRNSEGVTMAKEFVLVTRGHL